MRQRLNQILLILLLAVAAAGGQRVYSRNASQMIDIIPLVLDETDQSRKKVGALTFLAAWELRSDNSDFGGISGLIAKGDDQFLAVSDAGALIGFSLAGGSRLERTFIAELPGAIGNDVDYRDRDSEGMAYDPQSGRVWISYEARHAIRRFTPAMSRVEGTRRLAFARDWKANGGVEAIVRLNDGRFLILSETHERADGSNSGYVFSGDPVEPGTRASEFGLKLPAGYRPTDATLLPDGRVLLLSRRIGLPNGFSAKVAVVDPADIVAEETVEPKILATLAAPLLVDNMEGLAVTKEQGRIIIWMMSDNNFNVWQRTILMKFGLQSPNKKPEAETAPGFDSL